eukprot:gene21920-biopygen7164
MKLVHIPHFPLGIPEQTHVSFYRLRFEVCLNWHDGSTIFRSPVAAFAVAYAAAALKGACHTARAALHDK